METEIGALLTVRIEKLHEKDSVNCNDNAFPSFLEWLTLNRTVQLVKWDKHETEKTLHWHITMIAQQRIMTDKAIADQWWRLVKEQGITRGWTEIKEIRRPTADLTQLFASLLPGMVEPDTDLNDKGPI